MVLVEGLSITGTFVARLELPTAAALTANDRAIPIVVADLMAEMTEQGRDTARASARGFSQDAYIKLEVLRKHFLENAPSIFGRLTHRCANAYAGLYLAEEAVQSGYVSA